jgi:hypothetical protein
MLGRFRAEFKYFLRAEVGWLDDVQWLIFVNHY